MNGDGRETMEDAAGVIDADGQQSSHAMAECSGEAPGDGLGDDQGPLGAPAGFATSASGGSGTLLGLEPASVENTGQNLAVGEDSKSDAPLNPLLGTNQPLYCVVFTR